MSKMNYNNVTTTQIPEDEQIDNEEAIYENDAFNYTPRPKPSKPVIKPYSEKGLLEAMKANSEQKRKKLEYAKKSKQLIKETQFAMLNGEHDIDEDAYNQIKNVFDKIKEKPAKINAEQGVKKLSDMTNEELEFEFGQKEVKDNKNFKRKPTISNKKINDANPSVVKYNEEKNDLNKQHVKYSFRNQRRQKNTYKNFVYNNNNGVYENNENEHTL